MKPSQQLILGLCFATLVPLATNVGRNLEYEYALLSAWAALLVLPLLSVISQTFGGSQKDSPAITKLSFLIFLLAPFLAMVPGWLMFQTGYSPCNKRGFFFWMAIQFVPGWYVAAGMSLLVSRLGLSISKMMMVWAVILVFLIVSPLADLWFYPQKRMVSLALGFLHGPIYDDLILVDHGIVLGRLSHLLIGLSLGIFSVSMTSFRVRFVAWVSLVFAGLCYGLSWQYGSVGSGQTYLNGILSRNIQGDGFTLHYRPADRDKPPSSAILRMVRDTEFHIKELKEILGAYEFPHVDVYLYPDQFKKKLWFGGGSTDIADVVSPSIHITSSGLIHPTLRHELVHALTSKMAFWGLGFHPNMAFTEGLAVALAPTEGPLSLHEGAASLISSGKMQSMKSLFSPYFWRESGSRSYTIAGSFIDFMAQRYGMAGLLRAYSGASWQQSYELELDDLIDQWRRDVLSDFDQEKFKLMSEAIYRYPGVLNAQCPHSKEDLRVNPRGDPYLVMRQGRTWDIADDYYKWLGRFTTESISVQQLNLMRKIRELISPSDGQGEVVDAPMDKLEALMNWPPKVIEDIEVAIFLSDVESFTGDDITSAKRIADLVEYSHHQFLSPVMERQIYSRYFIDTKLTGAAKKEWRAYLGRWQKHIPEEKSGDPWILTYLRLVNQEKDFVKNWTADKLLQLEINPDIPQSFHLNWYRKLATSFAQLEDYESEAKAWKAAESLGTASQKVVFAQYARKAEFYMESPPLRTK